MIDSSLFENKRVKFHTLGCKLNFSESSAIGRTLSDAGFLKVGKGDVADLVVINTCSVTELADKKCRNAIRTEIKKNPGAFVVVTGCYAQLKPEDIAHIDGVDLVLGSNEKFRMLEFIDAMNKGGEASVHVSKLKDIKSFYPSYSSSDRTRCFLKVQDGCDYYCSYCTIPFARGNSRSGNIKSTVEMAEKAISEGAKELILTGVNIGDFGKNNGEAFFDLLVALDAINADVRYRISSIEPNLLSDEIIEFVASSKHISPHFHIPLQSGSNDVLKLMKRRYDTELFAKRVKKIKSTLPHAFIGIDVIVGVNGELDSYFSDAYNYISDLDFSQLHVFSYSERAGTKALSFDHKVSPQDKKERSQKLQNLSEKKLQAFYLGQTGKMGRVLFEKQKIDDLMFGFTENYVKVVAPYNAELVNTFTKVVLLDFDSKHDAMRCKID